MDWTIVVTGIVGIAGIGGTLLSARMASKSAAENLRTSISADEARSKVAEKRRIYANCLTAFTAHTHAAGCLALGAEQPPAGCAALEEDCDRTRAAAMNAASEVYLIGSPEVIKLANRVIKLALGAETGGSLEDTVKAFAELTGAMRRDLGKNVPPSGQMPDIGSHRGGEPIPT